MRCHGSIWRWSPFFGICKSKLSGASEWTIRGAKLVRFGCGRPEFSASQWASGPSPRHDTMPMPVIQASRVASAIDGRLKRQSDAGCGFFHGGAEAGVAERHEPEGDVGAADQLAVGHDFG